MNIKESLGNVFEFIKTNAQKAFEKIKTAYSEKIAANGGTPMFLICIAGVLLFGVIMIFDGGASADRTVEADYDAEDTVDTEGTVELDAEEELAISKMLRQSVTVAESAADKAKREAAWHSISLQQTQAVEEVEEEVEYVSPYANVAVTALKYEEDYVNVRSEASTEGEILGKIYTNCAAKILEEVDGENGTWYHIKSGTVRGYIKAEYFITGDDAEAKAIEIGKLLGWVNAGGLRLREEPSLESDVITSLWEGEIYTVLEDNIEGFTRISLGKDDDGNEVSGYVKSEYIDVYVDFDTAISKEEEEAMIAEAKRRKEEAERLEREAAANAASSKRDAVVAYAKQFLGCPYVWGGTSLAHGSDCSGFTKGVYAHFGIYISRTSGSQASCGTRVSLSNVRPGDLVFYAHGSSIYHVAMYIGGGKVIHAIDESRGIGISSMYFASPYCAISLF